MHNLIIFGGAFDPIHSGHMGLAKQVQDTFHFQKFIFLPSKQPVLNKQPSKASPDHRVHMIELAISPFPESYHFEIDDSEIYRKTPSYSVITLREYRKRYGLEVSITFLLGYDAFLQLPQWHHWEELFTLCNFLVIQRPSHINHPLPASLETQLQKRSTTHYPELLTSPQGCVVYYNAGNYDISSSQVRAAIAANQPLSADAIPPAVMHYLLDKKLYLP